jgi:hypothetical protein
VARLRSSPSRGPARYSPSRDDFIATLPKRSAASSCDHDQLVRRQAVSLREWCGTLARWSAEPVFEESAQALRGGPTDVTRMRELVGGTTVDWRDGMRRMAARFHPDLVGV